MPKSLNSILVTGGAGYIGSHIVEKLVKTKNNVIIVDNLDTGYEILINKKAKFIKEDIKNKKELEKIIKENNVDSIIHLAASLNVSESEKNKKKYHRNNIIGTKNILDSCRNSNVKNIIFSSSCAVYGNVKGEVNENNRLKPISYYGYTKLIGEKLIKKYKKRYLYNYGILRYFNVAGASSSGKIGEIQTSHGHLIKNIAIESQKALPKIKIFGDNYETKDGTCVRDYIHVSDLADIHVKGLNFLKKNKKSFILNCGYGKGYSVREIIDVFKKFKKNIIIKTTNRRQGDIAKVYSNTKKFKKILKFKPKNNNIKKIILSAINWEKKLMNKKTKI